MEVGCLRSVAPDLHNGILDNLHKLSFTSMSGPSQEVPGTRHHFTEGGRLVASKQIVYRVDTAGLDPVIITLLFLKIFSSQIFFPRFTNIFPRFTNIFSKLTNIFSKFTNIFTGIMTVACAGLNVQTVMSTQTTMRAGQQSSVCGC